MNKSKQKVAVAMSGGVDSSVTAFLLQKKGYEVVGVHMRLGLDSNMAENAARKVCEKLDIKFYPLNIAKEFKRDVKDYFLNAYKDGFTPNPCVNCNRLIKFGELFNKIERMGVDYLATGHYLRNQKSKVKSQNVYRLFKGIDDKKDQSYFLYNLNQDILKKTIFPLGGYKKDDVKKIALENNLPILEGESQDICFLSGDHNDYLKENIKLKKGVIKEFLPPAKGKTKRESREIGEHDGLPLYTIGQRRGVEIGGTGPYYVVKIDYKINILYVSKDHDDELLYSDSLIARDVNWIVGSMPKLPFECNAVVRYGHIGVECKVDKEDENILVTFKKFQRAVTKGQSVVFYINDKLLGGGIISD